MALKKRKDWLPHIQVKSLHFSAVAQYRKSIDETETGHKYALPLPSLRTSD